MISFANLLCVLLIYLIESGIPPGCSYELNVVYVQWKKYIVCYTTTTYEVHTFKNKNKKKSWRYIFIYHFLLFIRSYKFVLIETRACSIAYDEIAMSSSII